MDVDALHSKIYAKRLAAQLVVRTTREEGRTYTQGFASVEARDAYMAEARAAGFVVEIVRSEVNRIPV